MPLHNIDVKRIEDNNISINLVWGRETLNIISVYTTENGLSNEIQKVAE